MLDDEKQPLSQAVTDFPDPPDGVPATASPVPSGASACANGSRKTGIVLIDELPLRRTSTLNLLRRHFREATQLFAGTAEFLMHAPA